MSSGVTVAMLMGQAETWLGTHPRDGRDYDAQCGRCGSTLSFETCEECGGDGVIEGDDLDDDLDYTTCVSCNGRGAFPTCLSSEEFCTDNPLAGRDNTPRHTPEWFLVQAASSNGAKPEPIPASQAEGSTNPNPQEPKQQGDSDV